MKTLIGKNLAVIATFASLAYLNQCTTTNNENNTKTINIAESDYTIVLENENQKSDAIQTFGDIMRNSYDTKVTHYDKNTNTITVFGVAPSQLDSLLLDLQKEGFPDKEITGSELIMAESSH